MESECGSIFLHRTFVEYAVKKPHHFFLFYHFYRRHFEASRQTNSGWSKTSMAAFPVFWGKNIFRQNLWVWLTKNFYGRHYVIFYGWFPGILRQNYFQSNSVSLWVSMAGITVFSMTGFLCFLWPFLKLFSDKNFYDWHYGSFYGWFFFFV